MKPEHLRIAQNMAQWACDPGLQDLITRKRSQDYDIQMFADCAAESFVRETLTYTVEERKAIYDEAIRLMREGKCDYRLINAIDWRIMCRVDKDYIVVDLYAPGLTLHTDTPAIFKGRGKIIGYIGYSEPKESGHFKFYAENTEGLEWLTNQINFQRQQKRDCQARISTPAAAASLQFP